MLEFIRKLVYSIKAYVIWCFYAQKRCKYFCSTWFAYGRWRYCGYDSAFCIQPIQTTGQRFAAVDLSLMARWYPCWNHPFVCIRLQAGWCVNVLRSSFCVTNMYVLGDSFAGLLSFVLPGCDACCVFLYGVFCWGSFPWLLRYADQFCVCQGSGACSLVIPFFKRLCIGSYVVAAFAAPNFDSSSI